MSLINASSNYDIGKTTARHDNKISGHNIAAQSVVAMWKGGKKEKNTLSRYTRAYV